MTSRVLLGAALSLGLMSPVLSARDAHAAPPVAQPTSAAASAASNAQLGKAAPAFTLRDTDGKEVSLASLRGKVVVLEWFNADCPFAKYAHTKGQLGALVSKVSSDTLVWLSINSSAAGKQGYGVERNSKARQEYGITNALLLDEGGAVGRAYGAEKTPHLFVIDGKGVLRYRGGLDNAPMGVVDNERPRLPKTAADSLEPYLANAVEDLTKKRAVRMPETPAYGCGVKYAD